MSASQPIMVSASGPTCGSSSAGIAVSGPTPPQTVSGSGPSKVPYPGEDKQVQEWEPEYREMFSKNTLRMGIQGYFAGKYTKRYIETYLEFMHLSGWISNLEYLEYKRELIGE